MQKKNRRAGAIAGAVCLAVAALWLLSVRWLLSTWQHLSMDELVYYLKSSLGDGDPEVVWQYVLLCGLPAAAVLMLSLFVFKRLRRCWVLGVFALILSLAGGFFWLDTRVQVVDYLRAQGENSDFIAGHYADPAEVNITFPEDKRNLVYIFLESMEVTYADAQSGGAMEENLIPRLTEIARANEDFSGADEALNGAQVMQGATWTMGAMFAHTAGLPLKVSVEGNSMGEQESFFPGLRTLGDILHDAGYGQTLLIGSDAVFGGRKQYFAEHGNYDIRDYVYAQEAGWIDEKYFVFWGYEDEKLFAFAREEMTRLSAQDAPFHLSLLTVDTHFEDGYLCARCGEGDDQYSRVITCADCQIAELLAWMQQQPFYENTAVVLVGDHLTMDSDFCKDVPNDYTRRVYTAFVNAACESESAQKRTYSTFDMLPTTLAAMGVTIEGDRLALGANLFSNEKTLLEMYSRAELQKELQKNSLFMQEKAQLFVMQLSGYDPVKNTMRLYCEGLDLVDEKTVQVECVIGGERQLLYQEKTAGKRTLSAEITLPDTLPGDMEWIVSWVDKHGTATQGGGFAGHPITQTTDTIAYLSTLKNMKDCSILFAVKDDAGKRMTESIAQGLKALGLTKDLTGQYRASYCAVISSGKIEEDLGFEPLKMNGKLHDGIKYRLISAGFDVGNRVSIRIDGEEYAADYRGLNVVVYDHKTGTVLDSLSIDTNEEGDIKRR